jgi:hypothetical protein
MFDKHGVAGVDDVEFAPSDSRCTDAMSVRLRLMQAPAVDSRQWRGSEEERVSGALCTISDPEHWHRRADEMRRIAEEMSVLPHAKASMLRIAEEYDRLAVRAEEGLKYQKQTAR